MSELSHLAEVLKVSDERDPAWTDLPLPLRKVAMSAARLHRLTELDAPSVILGNEKDLLARKYLELGAWLAREAYGPADALLDAREDAEALAALAAHVAGPRHGISPIPAVASSLDAMLSLHAHSHAGAKLRGEATHDQSSWTEAQIAEDAADGLEL